MIRDRYLTRRKELEDNIQWYMKTIVEIEEQQNKRRKILEDLNDQLQNLIEDYLDGKVE